MVLTQKQRVDLYQATGVSISTIVKWANGGKVLGSIDTVLSKAASELGIGVENEIPADEVSRG
jgi:hypothetical protein